MIDWQLLFRGRGVCDVSYLLGASLQPEDRQINEMALLRRYHNILIENGIDNYTFDECFRDYRLSMLRGLHVFVVVVGFGALVANYGESVQKAMQTRLDAIFTDLKIGELLLDYA